jgi:hypothetical protein
LATFTDGTRGRLGLALLAVLPFALCLGHPFFADDFIHLERALGSSPGTGLLSWWVLRAEDSAAWWSPPGLAVPYFRPLVSLSFVADYAVFGRHPAGYHLTNLLLHACATLLVHAIAARVLGPGRPAFFAAALFAVHPAHAEAVLWVSGRTDLLAGVSGAAAVLLYLEARARPRARGFLLAGGLLALAASLLAKEVAVAIPLVLLVHALLVPGGERLPRRLVPPLLSAAVVAVYFAGRARYLGAGLPPHPFVHLPGDPDFLAHVLTAPFLYLADLVLFVPVDPVVTQPFWLAHPWALLLLAVTAAAVFRSSLRSVPDRHLAILALGWMAVALLPSLPASLGERFLYLPSVGYCLLIGAKAGAMDPRRWRPLVATAALVLAISVGRTLAFGAMAARSQTVLDDARAALEAAPGTSQLLVVDLPSVAALGFAHALRLERPGPLRVEILTLAPGFLFADPAPASEVSPLAGDRLLVRREVPYLGSYLERAFLGNRPPFQAGDVVERAGFSVLVREAPQGRLTAFEVRLREGAAAETRLLLGRGFRLQADARWPR